MANLNDTTIKVLKDLHDDINELLAKDSNIQVVWKLENLHFEESLLKSAELIRKSIK